MIRNEPIIESQEIRAAFEVLSSRELSMYRANKNGHLGGRYCRALEDAFCDFFHIKHAIAMNSATSCLHACCIAANVKEAYVPTITFSASASCVLQAGGTIKFTDIDPLTYCMVLKRPVDIAVAVHLHGHPADMDKIQAEFVIEDCSQAMMAKYKGEYVGTVGECGVFSFNQWKHISCGEGGMVITNDDNIADICRLVRNHGETQSDILGYNYRLTEIQAAIVLEQFKKLPQRISERIELAEYLSEKIEAKPYVRDDCVHTYFTYPIRTKNRSRLQSSLLEAGYFFGNGGQKPLHKYGFYKRFADGEYPVAEDFEKNVMFTDIIRPGITEQDLDKIAEIVNGKVLARIAT